MDSYHIFSGHKSNASKRVLKKSASFDNPVVIINGFNGSGKTLISPTVPNSIEEALDALESRAAPPEPREPVEEQTEEVELPNNVLDFTKRRKND